MIGYIITFLIGCCAGVFLTALITAAREEEE